MWFFLWACAAPEAPSVDARPAPSLAEQLYAGETGVEARKRGDRLRILVWLRALKLSVAQRKQLEETAISAKGEMEGLRQWEEARDQAELAALGPLYEKLSAQVLSENVEVEGIQKQIEAARKKLGSAQPERLKRLRSLLGLAQRWLDSLEPEQKLSFQHALFFLRQPVSPQLSPVYYDALVGVAWPDTSFESLRRLKPGEAPADPLDIGGLWSLDQGKTDTTAKMEELQQEVLLVLALLHPQMGPSLEVLGRRREVGDFSEITTP